MHRDLKPTNVLVEDGVGLLADLGLSRLAEGLTITGTGAMIGTSTAPSSSTRGTLGRSPCDARPARAHFLAAAKDDGAARATRPDDVRSLFWRGTAWRRAGEHDKAIADFEEVGKRSPALREQARRYAEECRKRKERKERRRGSLVLGAALYGAGKTPTAGRVSPFALL